MSDAGDENAEVVLEVRVLGPVEVVGESGSVRLPGQKHRRLLTSLVVHAGRTVASDVLTETL